VAANVIIPLSRWGANSPPQIPQLDLRGQFEAGEREEREEKGGKRKGGK